MTEPHKNMPRSEPTNGWERLLEANARLADRISVLAERLDKVSCAHLSDMTDTAGRDISSELDRQAQFVYEQTSRIDTIINRLDI